MNQKKIFKLNLEYLEEFLELLDKERILIVND
jgi:hypothetical protein